MMSFDGMGIYDDGGKGSPIVAFDAIKEYIKRPMSQQKSR